jgi:ribosomal protein L37AE/L43A
MDKVHKPHHHTRKYKQIPENYWTGEATYVCAFCNETNVDRINFSNLMCSMSVHCIIQKH